MRSRLPELPLEPRPTTDAAARSRGSLPRRAAGACSVGWRRRAVRGDGATRGPGAATHDREAHTFRDDCLRIQSSHEKVEP
eukprot:2940661-Prymnesium_polylepis.1